MCLAEKMDEKWEYLATSQLGFTREELVRIKHDNDTMITRIWSMLVAWRCKQPGGGDGGAGGGGVVGALCKAFVDCGRVDLAEMCDARLNEIT